MSVDGKDFGKEVGRIDEAREKYKTEELLAALSHSLSTNRRGSDCWGWPRLVRVSVSSINTCPPPNVAPYSASATDATTTGMRWQWAWRAAL